MFIELLNRTELGGSFPKYIEVNCPIIRTSVKIPLPIDGSDRKILSRSYILDQCRQLMEDSLEWKNLVQKPIQEGKKLELCWKAGTTVDWMWLKDAEEHNRDWELLYGLTLRYVSVVKVITNHLSYNHSLAFIRAARESTVGNAYNRALSRGCLDERRRQDETAGAY